MPTLPSTAPLTAASPPNESQRLAALHALAVLDTPSDPDFDDLVQLAAQICDTPMALITLVDDKRQWFKARLGVALTQTPREQAFCAHAITQPTKLMLVDDAREDARFADNALVTGAPHIRFYAGMPLRSADGQALGTLCVLDHQPRHLNPAQCRALQVLARQTMALLVLKRALAQRDEGRTRNRTLLRAIEQSPVSIVMANVHGDIEYVNPQFETLTGYTQAEVLGRNPRFLQSGDKSAEAYAELWQTITTGQTWRGEFRNKKKDGTLFWEQASISPVMNSTGLITHYVAVKEDITERRRIEAQLRTKNEDLRSFTYSVSHDLKAPLRGITGYAQELLRKHQDGMGERALFCLTQINTAAKNLDHLIEDLLQYSRLDADTPTASPFRLDMLVQRLLQDHSFTLTEQGAVVTVQVPPIALQLWERGLNQVLSNLISNAIKFSRHATPPKITLSAEVQGGRCLIRVSDNGIGFDMKYSERIFGLFSRLVRPQEFEGTGAGLAIVKKVLDKLGGHIDVAAAPGQGCTFTVDVPCTPPNTLTP